MSLMAVEDLLTFFSVNKVFQKINSISHEFYITKDFVKRKTKKKKNVKKSYLFYFISLWKTFFVIETSYSFHFHFISFHSSFVDFLFRAHLPFIIHSNILIVCSNHNLGGNIYLLCYKKY